MGNTYAIFRVSASGLKKVTNRGELFDLVRSGTTVADELDREDFLLSLFDIDNDFLLSELDKQIKNLVCNILDDCDMKIVSMQMVENAINKLKDLDKKVMSMPYDKGLESCSVGIRYEPANDLSMFDYTELYDGPEWRFRGYTCFGPSKEHVDILKEVVKVYHHRYYHYTFPWECNDEFGDSFGSYVVQRALYSVLTDMRSNSESKSVYIFAWY